MTPDGIAYTLITLCVVLMAMGYVFKRPSLSFIATGFWIILALQFYSLVVTVWDIYYGMFWISIGASIVAVLEGFVLRPAKKDDELANVLDHDSWEDYGEMMERYRDNLDKARRPTHRRQRERRNEEADRRTIRRMLK